MQCLHSALQHVQAFTSAKSISFNFLFYWGRERGRGSQYDSKAQTSSSFDSINTCSMIDMTCGIKLSLHHEYNV